MEQAAELKRQSLREAKVWCGLREPGALGPVAEESGMFCGSLVEHEMKEGTGRRVHNWPCTWRPVLQQSCHREQQPDERAGFDVEALSASSYGPDGTGWCEEGFGELGGGWALEHEHGEGGARLARGAGCSS